ncbi:hypothetical protein BJ165DRAFT_1113956 [Panaeolus papilionaceus]|nr:hypothetical protein BJ165DRAFT_1113956 [Panaeolus papilionaceus]
MLWDTPAPRACPERSKYNTRKFPSCHEYQSVHHLASSALVAHLILFLVLQMTHNCELTKPRCNLIYPSPILPPHLDIGRLIHPMKNRVSYSIHSHAVMSTIVLWFIPFERCPFRAIVGMILYTLQARQAEYMVNTSLLVRLIPRLRKSKEARGVDKLDMRGI